MQVAVRRAALAVALLGLVGCKVVHEQPKGRSPLAQMAVAPDQITLEIFSAPVPRDDPRIAALWSEVDEQPLPADVRRRLSENGMRAGVIGARLPDALAGMLKVTDARVADEQRSQVPVDGEPGVVLRVLQPRVGKRNDLVVSPVHQRVALLRSVDGEVFGKTYDKAEGRLVLRVFPEADGRLRLELVPELHHGEPKTQASGSEGMFIWTSEREKQTFADLKLTATLGAGEMLLVTCDQSRPSSIGHHFFLQQVGEQWMQRMWVVRVAQAGPDRAFADWVSDEPVEQITDQID